MKPKNKKILGYVLGALPLCMILLCYNKLPDLVPMQWNGGGVSRYGEKYELFLIGGLGLLIAFLRPISRKIDPRQENYERFSDVYETMILLISGFFSLFTGLTLFESLYPNTIPLERVVISFVGLLLVCLGNSLPKVRSNFFMGIKTPWTLSSEAVWYKTHRFAGKIFFFGGLAMIFCPWAFPEKGLTGVVLGLTLVICFVPMAMSYLWYRKEEKGNH